MKRIATFFFLSLLLFVLPAATYGQDSIAVKNNFPLTHTVFVGLQVPLNYTLGYRLGFSKRLSLEAQGGLVVAPFDRYTLKLLEGFGLDPTLSRVIDRSFRKGSSASLGLVIHSNKRWYGTLFGQYAHFTAGPITPADGLSVYFKEDLTSLCFLNSPAFVFNLQTDLWITGIRLGRSFQFTNPRFGLNTELSLGKIVATTNNFSSNQTLVDDLGITQQLYNKLGQEIDTKIRQHGFLPTINVLLTYRLR